MPILGFKSDSDLISYCELHACTERALFNGGQIKEMYRLADYPVPNISDTNWYSLKEEMLNLCKLARERLNS